MNTIKNILFNKKIGIDCTEEESAEIKGYLKEVKGLTETAKELEFFFPMEYDEFLKETKND